MSFALRQSKQVLATGPSPYSFAFTSTPLVTSLLAFCVHAECTGGFTGTGGSMSNPIHTGNVAGTLDSSEWWEISDGVANSWSWTFTASGSVQRVYVWGGEFTGAAPSASVFDNQNHLDALVSATSGSPGSVTPAQGGELSVAFVSVLSGGTAFSGMAVGSSFILDNGGFGANTTGLQVAYKIKGDADSAAENPSFTWTGPNVQRAVGQSFFKPGGGFADLGYRHMPRGILRGVERGVS